MITRLQVKNFRSIASADVSLGPLTVLVGRNGAGKSAFVDVLQFVRDALQHDLEYAFSKRQGIGSLRRWSATKPYDLEVQLSMKLKHDVSAEYGFVVGSVGGESRFRVKREHCNILSKIGLNSFYEARNGKIVDAADFFPFDEYNLDNNNINFSIIGPYVSKFRTETNELVLPAMVGALPIFRSIQQSINGNTYSIFPNTLRLPQTLSNEQELAKDGSNLASVLRAIHRSNTFFPDLRSALRRVVDGVQDVRVRQSGGYLFIELQHGDLLTEPAPEATTSKNADSNHAAQAKTTKAPWLGLEQESDGTLRILAMLTALYQPGSGALLTLEEPEISLHPGALAVLGDVIREASLRQQVIITTQSPDLISRFSVDELRVVERVNGATQIGPLDTVQRTAVVEQLFSAGDLLRIEGLRREPDETSMAAF